ncbi:hypothetical protein ACP70R_019989 [Stipagrostis hirtigluma subsp. patula]
MNCLLHREARVLLAAMAATCPHMHKYAHHCGARTMYPAATTPPATTNNRARAMAAATAVLVVLLPLLLACAPAAAAADEQETHIKVYWHDVVSGPDPTAVTVARAAVTDTSKTSFGIVEVIDDPLTDGPELNSSKLVGRAQGTYVGAGKDTMAMLMNMNFVFQGGSRYNGSSVAIMGRNEVLSAVREMVVVGGTGVFRWARGYALARTHAFDLENGDATVEYNLFIRHYVDAATGSSLCVC